jgi:homoserine O-acetyltransferase
MADDQIFTLPDFRTQGGQTLDLRLAYRVHGELNADKDNLVVLPTYYSGRSDQNSYWIGADQALDPATYCIVIPNLFGNGVSSSPSNTPVPFCGSAFPRLTYLDNVTCQWRMIQSVFGVETVHAVIGYSMGAMQAYQWAAQLPDVVQRFVAVCGSARTSEHNQLFIDAVCAALRTDAAWHGGNYNFPPTKGLEAFSVAYAAWFASQQFYSERMYRRLGMDDLAGVLAFAKQIFMSHDANDLLAMAATWRAGDVGNTPIYQGSFARAMAAITARGLIMPCDTDLYFTVRHNEQEAALLGHAEFAPIRSDFGHLAGGGVDSEALAFMTTKIHTLLQS